MCVVLCFVLVFWFFCVFFFKKKEVTAVAFTYHPKLSSSEANLQYTSGNTVLGGFPNFVRTDEPEEHAKHNID